MDVLTSTEENYLKTIYLLNEIAKGNATTNSIAEQLKTKASSVSDMLRKLKNKDLINYEKYQAASLNERGSKFALEVIRKHRLWETFLVDILKFGWIEVDEIAEQMKHINSPALVNRINSFLNNPKYNPHGDPIPDINGNMPKIHHQLVNDLKDGEKAVIVGFKDHSTAFLQYIDAVNLMPGTNFKLIRRFDFDQSAALEVQNGKTLTISSEICNNLYISIKPNN